MAEQKDIMKGVWVVVMTSGTNGMIGKLAGHWQLEDDKTVSDKTRDHVFGRPVIQLSLALDYFTPIRPQPAPGPNGTTVLQWARDPLIMRHDFTGHPVLVAARWEHVKFIADMHEDDQRVYMGFITGTLDHSAHQRAAAAGIVMPKGDKEVEKAIAAIAAAAKNGGTPSPLLK